MAAAIKMGPRTGSWLVSEANAWRSRDEDLPVTIPAEGLKSGQVMKEAAGKLVPVTAAVDEPAGILLFDQDRDDPAVAQDKVVTIIARDAEVFGPGLTFFEDAEDEEKRTMGDALVAQTGLTVRWK